MISYLKGTIKYRTIEYVVLVVKGSVGYKIFTNTFPGREEEVEFWIYHHIKEDKNDLYGFKNQKELGFFEKLLSVNGVGPRMALNIIKGLSIEQIEQAISEGDIKTLTTIKGLGKKVAGKIIIELKGKLSDDKIDFDNTENVEVISAMQALGYNKNEITPFISKIPQKLSKTQEKVKWILKNIK